MLLIKFVAIIVIVAANAKPFLYDPNQALSLIASSSNPQQTHSNIADLRRSKARQLEKLAVPDDPDQGFHQEPYQNEAIPGILQKKLAKILKKLQFLSSLSNPVGNEDNPDDDDQDVDLDIDEHDTEYTGNVSHPVTTDVSNTTLREKENYTEKDVEEITQNTIPDVNQRLNAQMYSLGSIIRSMAQLAYRMIVSPFYKNNPNK